MQKLYSLKHAKFFFLSGYLLLRETPSHIAICLKSIDFKLFFVYSLNCSGAPFGTSTHNFTLLLQTYDLLQSLSKMAQKKWL